jgi:hypothetical protein
MTMSQQARPGQPARRLLTYLERRASDGEIYVKSKFLAEDLDLSASQIGVLLGRMQDSTETLHIEQWSYTNATTWRVAPKE